MTFERPLVADDFTDRPTLAGCIIVGEKIDHTDLTSIQVLLKICSLRFAVQVSLAPESASDILRRPSHMHFEVVEQTLRVF